MPAISKSTHDRVHVGEVLEWTRGMWRVVRIGNVVVKDRRRVR